MGDWFRDARLGFRSLLRRPGFTVVVVVTFALGIGANAAIFSVVNAVLLRPLPYPDPDRLVRVWSAYPADGEAYGTTSPLDLEDWRRQNDVFEDMAGFPRIRLSGYVLTGGERPSEIETMFVTEGFFSTLGVPAFVGRTLSEEDFIEGRNRVVVLSHGAWLRRFGGDPDIVGSTLGLRHEPFTVVGVMPAGFDYPSEAAEMWAPMSLIPESGVPRLRQVRWLAVVARLKPDVSIDEARAALETIARRLAETYPESNERLTSVTVRPLYADLVGDVRTALLTVFAAVGLVLLIGCVNVLNLVAARSEGRGRELALRTALGAGRWTLARQLVVENLLLGALGGGLGLVLAYVAVDVVLALAPGDIPRLSGVEVDGVVLAFTAVVAIACGLVIGLLAAMRAAASEPGRWLKEGRSPRAGGRTFRGFLVVTEVAVVVVLAVSASLLMRSYARLVRVDPGVDSENLLTMSVNAQQYKYPESADFVGFFERVRERVEAIPGVHSAAWVRPFPLRGDTFDGEGFSFTVDGKPAPPEGREPEAAMRFVSPGYFRTMGIPLLAGRDFDERDRSETFVVVVNRTAAERYWPGEDPVGQAITVGDLKGIEVIGVVGDIRQLSLAEEPTPAIYVTLRQVARVGMTLVVRTVDRPSERIGAVQNAIWEIEPDQPLEQVATMESVIDASVAEPRFSMTLLGMFAALAIVLAAVGIFGVMSYDVTQTTHDIGIRMAVGAGAGDVVKMIVGRAMTLAGVGIVLGFASALAITRFLKSLLYGVSASDPVSFALSVAVLTGVAVAASAIPATRAARVDPVVALRHE